MRFSALVSLAVALVHFGAVDASVLTSRKTSEEGLIVNLNNQLPLPGLHEAKVGIRDVKLNTDDIQGLTMVGMRFMMETFYFFNINDAAAFKSKLGKDFHPLVTTATQLLDATAQPDVAINIGFSAKGLSTIGVNDDLGDPNFATGQAADAVSFGDPGTVLWREPYRKGIHGIIQVAGKEMAGIEGAWENIKSIFGDSISEVHKLHAHARPGAGKGREHFGWVDGITQPAVEGWDTEKTIAPGQMVVKPGVILVGEDGDNVSRPAWAKSGSFLSWRQLEQLVPEFHRYLNETAFDVPGLTRDESIHLFGSRMVGRWKSGAPIDLSPFREDAELGADPTRRNNFNFDHPEFGSGFTIQTNQTFCPFSAHILRSRPRGHFKPEHPTSHMMRGGLPYGPEVTDAEQSSAKTSEDPAFERGMAFAAYQSSLAQGFIFVQRELVNNKDFPAGSNTGVDAIIGALNTGPPGDAPRTVTGMDWTDHSKPININKGK
ncbi:hypothetical protein V5O48_016475 [Marasmius crinis-equi]|uniref:DyP dimeric alpha+beta barrel domain-containing protein n=1 Tax=Marasmius crinis-equi TaxID=585013 RepID=A0ABR3ERM4_9AGAR